MKPALYAYLFYGVGSICFLIGTLMAMWQIAHA